MDHVLMIVKDAGKTLWRRGGLLRLAGLVFFVGIVCFVAFDGQLILAQWHRQMMEEFRRGYTMTLPYLVPLAAFRILAGLLALVAGLACTATLNSSFRQISISERDEFQIMGYLGAESSLICRIFALQPTLIVLVTLPIAGVMADILYINWLAPVRSREAFGSLPQMLGETLLPHLGMAALVAGYVYWRNNSYLEKQLGLRFDDPHYGELVGDISEEW